VASTACEQPCTWLFAPPTQAALGAGLGPAAPEMRSRLLSTLRKAATRSAFQLALTAPFRMQPLLKEGDVTKVALLQNGFTLPLLLHPGSVSTVQSIHSVLMLSLLVPRRGQHGFTSSETTWDAATGKAAQAWSLVNRYRLVTRSSWSLTHLLKAIRDSGDSRFLGYRCLPTLGTGPGPSNSFFTGH